MNSAETFLATARQVITDEAKALDALADALIRVLPTPLNWF